MSPRPRAGRHGAIRAPEESFSLEDERVEVPGSSQSPLPDSVEPRALGSRVASALRLGLGLALVIGTSVSVAYSVRHYALTSPRFSVQEVKLIGGKRVSPERAQKDAGVTLGENIFTLDTAQAERKLLENPWIAEARVTRDLPRALRVEIKEREPTALAVFADRLYLVSAEGEPFKELAPGDPADYPLITGVSVEGLSRDRAREIDRVKQGLDVLEQYGRVPLSKTQPAQEVHLADSGEVVLTAGKEGITFELGKDAYRRKLLMAEQVVGEMRRKGRSPGIVFLDNQAHPERVVVRMK
ncbi:MAG TPA: FtsQ-type POTRA domain-containing protein [Polyangiaceae bacterium]|nr:FtsQ-type POTRA domain-containing protein [Polyangiaceae bacterium]